MTDLSSFMQGASESARETAMALHARARPSWIIADWLPMLGITYDSRNELLDVALDKLNHLIRQPTDIMVAEGPAGLTSVAVVDGRGVRQVIRMKEPLMLTAAAGSRSH